MPALQFRASVSDVREVKKMRYVSGTGSDAVFEPEPAGWLLVLDGWSIHMENKPDFNVGETVTISVTHT